MSADTVTIGVSLAEDIWRTIKAERDLWANLESEPKAEKLTELLVRMKKAGMADWIPTIDDVIAHGPYVRARD